MRPEPVELKFGERSFKIRPLTLGQIERVDSILQGDLAGVARSVEIIKVAIERDYPDVDVRELELPLSMISEYTFRVLKIGGMVEMQPGEPPAVPSSGIASTEG